jgi:hypothetical protein
VSDLITDGQKGYQLEMSDGITGKQETDILSLSSLMHSTPPPNVVIQIYKALLRASRSHVRALAKQALDIVASVFPKWVVHGADSLKNPT